MHRFIAALACAFIAAAPASADIVTFEDIVLSGSNAYLNGSMGQPGSFASGGAVLNNYYDTTFQYWSGWSISNVKDNVTPGYLNQYAAFTPNGGDASSQYAVAYAYSQGDATIALPSGQMPASIRVANTTYAAMSMKNGDQFTDGPFGGADGNRQDFMYVTIVGLNSSNQSTGSVVFYLADYRFADNTKDYFVSDWTTISLASLGPGTTSLSFGVTSSDFGTPTYVAVDNLTLAAAAVPEPGSLALAALAGLGASIARFMRRRRIVAA